MAKSSTELSEAQLEWKDGLPIAKLYGDSYYSDDSGLEETRHVFIEGNEIFGARDLPQQDDGFGYKEVMGKMPVVIAETGFGTGLNFLVFLEAWQKAGEPWPLRWISVEKHPLASADLIKAHNTWPSLTVFADQLQAQWPTNHMAGWLTLHFFQSKIQLEIFHGDLCYWCSELLQRQIKPQHWMLDGFTPAKNPEMWSDELFKTMALSAGKGTTFATYTSAGFVRRALSALGFKVEKVKGYGRKRSMLKGRWPE